MDELKDLAHKARELSYSHHGRKITFYIPGMFYYNGIRGNFPAISITGQSCQLHCHHCQGKLLHTMIPVRDFDELIAVGERLAKDQAVGFLLSGGFDTNHTLPIKEFIPAIKRLKEKTNLKISLHCGILDPETCYQLKDAGLDQALIDVIGADETIRRVYHTKISVREIFQTIENLLNARITVIPHIVIGIDYGRIIGEYRAIDLLSILPVETIVLVSLMPLPGTPMEKVQTPSAEDIARLIIYARFKMPQVALALGCARKRGVSEIDLWALECGINRIALPADEAVAKAQHDDLAIEWAKICCSF
ncbi:MAG: radical SAM protein [candidate division WOR-3 bacterium]